MEISIFTDKSKTPNDNDLASAIGDKINFWIELKNFVYEKYPKATEEWKHSGAKYGWNFSIKDKKRAIIYFLPRENYFKVGFSFGQKAFETILNSAVSDEIKLELENARVYVEGRGIRIPVNSNVDIEDIKKLIEIKIAN
jgi:hypothetical protein